MNRREVVAAAACAVASPALPAAPAWRPVEGRHYARVRQPAPVGAESLEVLMFFTYGCRHCLAVEPLISQWEASLSPKVRLRRLPFALWDDFIILQDLYFAMDALGLVAQLHARVYHAVQGERRRLETEDQIGEFVARQGLDVHQFISTLNSDAVAARTRDASELAGRFEVSDIPTFVVGHRWKTDVPRAGSINKALAVVDFLARSGR